MRSIFSLEHNSQNTRQKKNVLRYKYNNGFK